MSFYYIKKRGAGAPFCDFENQEIVITYKIFKCRCSNSIKCKECQSHEIGTKHDEIENGKIKIVLGQNIIHEFIEDTLLNKKNNITRGSVIFFVLEPKDAFEEQGYGNIVSKNDHLCIQIEDPEV